MHTVEFICLANSWKKGGKCVAGWRTDGLGWIRPVSSRSDGTLASQEYLYADGTEAALLDIIEVKVTAPRPEPHQPENWVVRASRWRLMQHVSTTAAGRYLAPALVSGPNLLGDQSHRIAYATLQSQPAAASLALVEPQTIQWYVTTTSRGRRQTRCCFHLGGTYYDLPITDPQFEARLASLTYGFYPRDIAGIAPQSRVLLTVSLGGLLALTGYCYKLVAAVLVL